MTNSTSTPYNQAFFENIQAGSRTSAQRLVPLLIDLVHPVSVIDVGCGSGEFLQVFAEQGVSELLGVDGAYASSQLTIPRARFRPLDLRKPFRLKSTFDLAISLEVGEHLPPESASGFVYSLTRLAPVILFSAAAPFQGGTHHLNEQWPDYWAAFFAKHGYHPVDAIRPRVWDDERIAWWYRQNAMLYCREEALATYPALKRAAAATSTHMLNIVHPAMYQQWHKVVHPALSDRLRRRVARIRPLKWLYHTMKKPIGYVSASV